MTEKEESASQKSDTSNVSGASLWAEIGGQPDEARALGTDKIRVVDAATDTTTGSLFSDMEANRAKAKAAKQSLTELLHPVRWWILAGQICAVISGVLAITPYIALVQIGDLLLKANSSGSAVDTDRLWSLVIFLIFGLAGRVFFYSLGLGLTHWADLKLGLAMRQNIVSMLSRVPLAWFSESSSGKVRKSVQNDTHTIHYLIAHQPVEMVHAVVMPLAALAYAFWIDWRLGLLAVATLPIYVGLYAYLARDMGAKNAEVDARMSQLSARIVEFVSGITVVKAFGKTGKAHSRYAEAAREFSEYYAAWCKPLLRIAAICYVFVAPPLILLINLAGGALMVDRQWVTPVEVLATSLIALMLPASIMTVGMSVWSKQNASTAAHRIIELLKTEKLSESESSQTPADNSVTFDHVSFSFGKTLALDDVTLSLPAESITALVGPSGSGKTTLATLVARFQDPTSGTVSIGGVDVKDMPNEELYKHVAFVLQDAQLLRISLLDNIRLARPDASLDDVRKAARHAQIDDVIIGLPKGYDTVLGEDTNFSGGQEQRVAIARAILADAPILVLDEATAFADPESEAAIQDALSLLIQGRTVLVIAHRLGSIIGADQIIVLNHGRVIACGTHDDLLKDPGYALMWNLPVTSEVK